MRVLDLFSGIGMYALGCEQAGHEIIGFCENDTWARKILKKHWPMKPISSSIQSLNQALIASLGDSHAKTSALVERKPDCSKIPPEMPLPVQDSSGRWCEPFAWYDHATQCWRTFQQSLWGGYHEYSAAWPASGMILSGIAYQREARAHPTIALESTWLPTCGAQEGKGSGKDRFRGSPNFRGAKMSEGLRTCMDDPIYLNPSFAEVAMGLEKGYTELETETLPASSEK